MARKHGKDRGIVFKGGKWWCRVYVNGREKWHRADNKTQARALYGRLKAEIREGKYFPEKFETLKDITLRVWIDRYLEGSTNRGIGNERRYGRFWIFLLGKKLLTQITTEDCRRIQAKLKARGRLKPATVNRKFAFLRRVLMIAVKDGKLNRNPVSGLKFFPEARRTRYFLAEELQHLQAVMKPKDWAVVAFAIETGLRRGEQFGLKWAHVSLETSTLTIPLPKGGKTRHVPLSDNAKEILRSLGSFLESPWVFPSPMDSLHPRNAQTFVNKIFTPALRKVGITDACWHTLRHTAASRRVMSGVDLFVCGQRNSRPPGYPNHTALRAPVAPIPVGCHKPRKSDWNRE
jgi:integrase